MNYLIRLLISTLLYLIPSILLGQKNNYDFLWKNHLSLKDINYQSALDTLPNVVNQEDLVYYKALINLNSGKIADAYDQILLHNERYINNESYEAKFLNGLIQLRRLAPKPALMAFESAMEIDKNRPEAYVECLRLYLKNNNPDYGIRFAQKSIKKFPDEIQLYLYRGIYYFKYNALNKSAQDLIKVVNSNIEIDSLSLSTAYFGLAKYNIEKKNYSMAFDYAQKSLSLKPNDPHIFGLLGEVKYNQGELDEALNYFGKMLDKFKNANYYPLIAKIYEQKGDIESACLFYTASCQTMIPNNDSCKEMDRLKCDK